MANFLNGIETIEVDVGGRVISTPSTSVIGVVGTMSGTGVETKFPLNTPVLVTKVQDIVGFESGIIPSCIRGIYNQVSAICIVVRIDDGADINETIINAAGDITNYSGVYALMNAELEVKVKPKLLLCPYLSSILTEDNKPNSIVNNLIDIADKLRAVAIIDGPNLTNADAIDFVSQISSSRAYVIDPTYKPTFEYTPSTVSSSSLVAGVFAKNDADKGFWWSPSNTDVKGIAGINRPISFALSDPTSDSNMLNAVGVSTLIFSGGAYKIWGNRSPSEDTKWHYISVRRTVDTVYDAIEQSMLWALARPFSKQLFSDIENNIQSYLNTLISQGALLGGAVWVDASENTLETYTEGQLIVSFDLEPVAPVERLTFKAYRNSIYIDELFQ